MSGSELRRKRVEMGLTQAQLGFRLGCSRAHVCRLEDRAEIPRIYDYAVRYLVSEQSVLISRDAA